MITSVLKELVTNNPNRNLSICVSLTKKIWLLNFLRKKLIHVKEKVFYILSYLKTFKAVHKNNLRTHSPQENKKAVLTTAAYFKVSTPVKS